MKFCGDLGATYDVHLGLIRKRVVNFLLALNLLIFRHVLRLKRYGRKLVELGDLQRVGHHPPNFYIEGDVPTNHFCTDG